MMKINTQTVFNEPLTQKMNNVSVLPLIQGEKIFGEEEQ